MFARKTVVSLFMAGALISIGGVAQAGNSHVDAMKALVTTKAEAFTKNALVIRAVKAQNTRYQSLNEADVVKLDEDWRAEKKSGGGPLVDTVLASKLSDHLNDIKGRNKSLIFEVIVMDDKGMNVGQTDLTSDYWQGDEDKWQQTYLKGVEAVHIGEVEDEKGRMVAQLSLPISDENRVIGAVTIGIDVDALKKM